MTERQVELAQDVAALKALARDRHQSGVVTTACFCACGNPMGGPAGPPACKALRAIGELLLYFEDRMLTRSKKPMSEHLLETFEVLLRTLN